jgi:hypothetical protein
MRILLVLILFGVAAFFACSSPSEDDSSTRNSYTEEVEPAADGLEEFARTPMDKAQNVENVLQDAADERNAAIEEASDDN